MSRWSEQVPRATTHAAAPALPRPNRGPEPWRDDAAPWLAPALVAAATIAILAAILRRRRRPETIAPASVPADESPEARLLLLCDGLRVALAARFGSSLRARTTEEIAADPRVAELLGDDLSRLSEVLKAGDRIKFARREAVEGLADDLAEWTDRAESLESLIRRPPDSDRRPDRKVG